jgi:hypothetical protein
MTPQSIIDHMLARYEGLSLKDYMGDRAFFHNPGKVLPLGTLVAALTLNTGVGNKQFRFTFRLSREEFIKYFGPLPATPTKGDEIAGTWDYSKVDEMVPHRYYGWDGTVGVLMPTAAKFEAVYAPLVDAAHKAAVKRFRGRVGL